MELQLKINLFRYQSRFQTEKNPQLLKSLQQKCFSSNLLILICDYLEDEDVLNLFLTSKQIKSEFESNQILNQYVIQAQVKKAKAELQNLQAPSCQQFNKSQRKQLILQRLKKKTQKNFFIFNFFKHHSCLPVSYILFQKYYDQMHGKREDQNKIQVIEQQQETHKDLIGLKHSMQQKEFQRKQLNLEKKYYNFYKNILDNTGNNRQNYVQQKTEQFCDKIEQHLKTIQRHFRYIQYNYLVTKEKKAKQLEIIKERDEFYGNSNELGSLNIYKLDQPQEVSPKWKTKVIL